MIFKRKIHNTVLYNTLLVLSRNIFFYKDLSMKDTFETRIYLMFFHYSIILLVLKKKNFRQDQDNYNSLFFSIEDNLRELGFGDITVNKKMKELNKLFYDILLKLNNEKDGFKMNKNIIKKYFNEIFNNDKKVTKLQDYFENFYNFCFEIQDENMIKELKNYKF